VLSGTPTTVGNYSLSVTGANAHGATGTATYTIAAAGQGTAKISGNADNYALTFVAAVKTRGHLCVMHGAVNDLSSVLNPCAYSLDHPVKVDS
jgi:hypothetical protein